MAISKSASLLYLAAVVTLLVGIPLGLLYREASRRGRPFNTYLAELYRGEREGPKAPVRATRIDFLEERPIGDPVGESPPWITHVAIVDLDGDGLKDVVLCDGKLNYVAWIQQQPAGTYRETRIGTPILAPAHVTPSDIDGDGDIDLLVAKMGTILPNNDEIGAVVVLENDGEQGFTNRVLADNIARVTDIEPGDFDGDGDVDLAVGQFGYDDGEIRWMENEGGWQFASHNLLNLSGTIHTPVGDLDGDGDLDIAAVVSQHWEEVFVFENDGEANFEQHLIYGATNEDFGSSGISLTDLDLDGDLDVLYTNGDAFDYIPPGPRPWHGVQWLQNEGRLDFTYHRIGDFPGAFFANGVDADRDGDMDVVVVSAFNDWTNENAQSMSWFDNDGHTSFTRRGLASAPTHLLALASADMDGDGFVDFVTGGMYTYPPFDRMSRVTLWLNHWPDRSAPQRER